MMGKNKPFLFYGLLLKTSANTSLLLGVGAGFAIIAI